MRRGHVLSRAGARGALILIADATLGVNQADEIRLRCSAAFLLIIIRRPGLCRLLLYGRGGLSSRRRLLVKLAAAADEEGKEGASEFWKMFNVGPWPFSILLL